MKIPLFIARRYFLSNRKQSFINYISLLSMAVLAICTAALIIVLSVFNGLGDLLRSVNSAFDPQLRIEAVKRKTFEATPKVISDIKSVEGVDIVSEVIEDYAYVRYLDIDMPVILRGISDNFIDQKRLDDNMISGELALHRDSIPFAIIGEGVKRNLRINIKDDMHAMQIFYIRNVSGGSLDPSRLYARKSIRPGGVFSIEKNFDENYVFVPLDFAQELFNYRDRRTFIEIKTTQGSDLKAVKRRISEKLGAEFNVLTNEEQHKDLYRLLNLEKVVAMLALSAVVLVGSINIFFSLMMLAIDKKKDVSVMIAMGAQPNFIRRIFISEGAIIAFTGAITGITFGGVFCFLQDKFGIISMGMENAIVSAYPVKMLFSDFAVTALVVVLVTILTSFYPASVASRSYSVKHL
ncbi:MAG TPA: FtsX-like permease family protein [Cyclobacteriaceae bacterium]|nr:FtsX-like permease family protein [Cyclobacteriaceae bacterium]